MATRKLRKAYAAVQNNGPGYWIIAEHPGFGRPVVASVFTDERDARAMAAARELVAALEWALPYAERAHRAEYGDADTDTAASVLRARAALAAAIGEG